LGQAWKSSPRR